MAKKKNADWIKIDTDIITNDKMLLLEEDEKDGLYMELLWFKLLCLAGMCNDNGRLSVTNEKPYTATLIAKKTNIPLQVVKKALDLFVKYNMMDFEDSFYSIKDWNNHQNERFMSNKKKEYDRRYQQERRDAKKSESEKVAEESYDYRNDTRQISSVSVSNNSSNNNTNNELDSDFEKAWNKTIDAYPKKDSAVMAKATWLGMISKAIDRKEMARLIYSATKLYVKDFESDKSFESNGYRYMKNYDRFLKEDCDYWISEHEKITNKMDGS